MKPSCESSSMLHVGWWHILAAILLDHCLPYKSLSHNACVKSTPVGAAHVYI